MQNQRLLITINSIHNLKVNVKMHLSVRKVGQTITECMETFEIPKIRDKCVAVRRHCHIFVSYMYDSKAWVD